MTFPPGIGSSLLVHLQRLGGPFPEVSLTQMLPHKQKRDQFTCRDLINLALNIIEIFTLETSICSDIASIKNISRPLKGITGVHGTLGKPQKIFL